jgi:peptide/nickel transport system substrate-binding protein
MFAANWDPTGATINYLPIAAIYDGFFGTATEEYNGGFRPALATGYERSEDWKTVTVTLRDDVTFTDGEPLTAEGVRTYLEGMAATEGWWFTYFWDKNSPTLTAIDATTLVITSDKPMPTGDLSFLGTLFNAVAIASPNSLNDLAASASEPIGSGPYVIEEVIPDVSVTVTRNEDFWDPTTYPFDVIEFVVFADPVAALNALKSGQIDTTELPIPYAADAENEGFTLTRGPGLYTALFVADREGTVVRALADKRVRHAMALAFDRPAINEALNLGYGMVTSQAFDVGDPEYVEGGDDRYGYDPERARELLSEAGYPDGFDLLIPSTPFGGINTWEPVVAQYLGDIGIRVTFDTIGDTGAYFDAISTAEYPVLMYGPLTGVSTVPMFLATSDGAFNGFGVVDEKADAWWYAMRNGPDAAAAEAAAAIGEYALEEAIVVPFVSSPKIWASADGVEIDDRWDWASLWTFQLAD